MTHSSTAPASSLFTWMEKAATTRPGSVPSFIMIIVNLAKTPGYCFFLLVAFARLLHLSVVTLFTTISTAVIMHPSSRSKHTPPSLYRHLKFEINR